MNVKKLILNAAPYGLVRLYQRKKKKSALQTISFWDEYTSYLSNHEYCSLADESPVRIVVSVQGFGHSGSGAVVDLLREYEGVVVVGGVDDVGSCASQTEAMYEVDFLRSPGGLFEIEQFLGTHNVRFHDALLHRFILLIQQSDLYQKVPSTRNYFYEFFRQICINFDPYPWQLGNPYLDYKGINNALFLRQMSVSDYRRLCRKLLNSIFGCYPVKKTDVLVLDQLVTDREYDMERYREYIPNLKTIMVYRDPRDVYLFAKEHNVFWIPTSSVDTFLSYFKICSAYLSDFNNLKGYYIVSFERILKEYNDVVNEIELHLGISNKNHVHPLSALRPDISIKGVGLWKNHPELKDDLEKIYTELPQFIYYKSVSDNETFNN